MDAGSGCRRRMRRRQKVGHLLIGKGVGSEMNEDGEGGLGSIPASRVGAPPPLVSPRVLLLLGPLSASPSRPGQPFIPFFLFQRARFSPSPLLLPVSPLSSSPPISFSPLLFPLRPPPPTIVTSTSTSSRAHHIRGPKREGRRERESCSALDIPID